MLLSKGPSDFRKLVTRMASKSNPGNKCREITWAKTAFQPSLSAKTAFQPSLSAKTAKTAFQPRQPIWVSIIVTILIHSRNIRLRSIIIDAVVLSFPPFLGLPKSLLHEILDDLCIR